MRCVATLLALTGCSSIFGLHEPAHNTGVDAPLIDTIDGPMSDGPLCVGRGELTVCFDAPPSNSVTLPAAVTTGDLGTCSQGVHWASAQQPQVCFIAGQNIVQSGTTVVTGPRPLVLVASGTIHITALLDASSHIGAGTGPGSDPSACAGFAMAPAQDANGGGGGAGGSFVSAGGSGGGGNGGAALGGQPAAATAASTVLRGGCAGQAGAPGAGIVGVPGAGGGVIYLAAGAQLQIDGPIAASGAGAQAPRNRSGGSGGGAGGMIVLDAPSITLMNAFLTANGGGGAAGADGNIGIDGSDPSPTSPSMPALGGGAGRGGPGGQGAAGNIPAGDGQNSGGGQARGGGGGGGGIGVIYAPTNLGAGASISPPVTLLP